VALQIEKEDAYEIKADIPGVHKSDIHVSGKPASTMPKGHPLAHPGRVRYHTSRCPRAYMFLFSVPRQRISRFKHRLLPAISLSNPAYGTPAGSHLPAFECY